MTDQIEDDLFPDGDDGDDAREESARLLRGRGLRAAVRAAVEVCENGKAPPNARATAAGLIFRANGLLEVKKDDDALQPHEMDPAQLARALADAKAKAADLEQPHGRRRQQKAKAGIFD